MSADLLGLIAQAAEYLKTHKIETYKPYPFQLKFHAAGSQFQYRFLLAGQQIGKCCSLSSKIDTTDGEKKLQDIWGKDVEVLTWPDKEPRKVVAWIKKPAEEIYRITMSDGRWVECPKGHRILTNFGYLSLEQIAVFLPQELVRAQSLSRGLDFLPSVRASGLRLSGTLRGYWGRCLDYFRLRGGRLLYDGADAQVYAPLQDGVRGRSLIWFYLDGLATRCTYILQRSLCRLASWRDALPAYFQSSLAEGYAVGTGVLRSNLNNRDVLQSDNIEHPERGAVSARQHRNDLASSFSSGVRDLNSIEKPNSGFYRAFQQFHDDSFSHGETPESVLSWLFPVLDGNKIISIYSVGVHNLYDMEVEERHNYLAAGLVHHNSLSNLCETTYHLTGLYPDWWTGVRFKYAVDWWLGGQSTKKVRDNLQKKLLGDHEDPSSFGTGWVPRELIGKVTRMAGIPGSLDAVKVKHVSGGWSNLQFKTYEQKVEEWMGETMDGISLDEEPGQDIFSQCVIRTLRKKGIILITATPEQGKTEVVKMFMDDKKPGTWYAHASMDDAPHYTSEGIDLALSVIPAHEREMRRKGLPIFGSGLVFMASDEQIRCEPFPIPAHYHRIGAIDFGYDHPFASVHCAWDKENDVFYVYDLYTEKGVIPLIHAAALNRHESWIPIAWPHDGLNTEKGSGTPLAQIYRDNGVNLMTEKFTNPPAEDQKEGEGGNKIWPGLIEMNQDMLTGKFKVFSNLSPWFIEKASYHCDKNGDLVQKGEDIMSATRYAYMSRRHAITKPVLHIHQPIQQNYWMS